MTHQDILRALETLRPGAEYVLYGTDLSKLLWLDTKQSRPTDAAILSVAKSK